ncbi:hypothetical protein RJ55_06541 [Drechmeria coniospora]|nr:hypothetical protein RJ55_06541 [Drechmeria coniospora]
MDLGDGTAPLDESFAETVAFSGRIFQKYALKNDVYFAPIDEDEIERLELMHATLRGVFDNRLLFPPILSPRRILDCGCGAGGWAVEVARKFPKCEVLGIDVSPHMVPDDTPNNLEIQIDDLNKKFTFPPDHFDLVHSQMVVGGIHADRWRNYIGDILRVLQPGGWCQTVEIYYNAQSDNGRLERDHALSKWSSLYLGALHPRKDPRAPMQIPNWMRSAGFTDVESRLLTMPMCAWPKAARDHAIGEANGENVARLLRSLALYPFTQMKGMTKEDFEALIEQAIAEAHDPSFKAYFPLYVCIGRKPQR